MSVDAQPVAVHAAQFTHHLTEPCLLPSVHLKRLWDEARHLDLKQHSLIGNVIDHPYRIIHPVAHARQLRVSRVHSLQVATPRASAVVQPSPAETHPQAMAQPGQAAIAEDSVQR